MTYPITEERLSQWSESFQADPQRKLAALALSKSPLNDVAFVPAASFKMRQKFSVEVPTLEVTNQQASGRCWLFAATNLLREKIARDLNMENFQLSQSYLAFWDKFERANFFLESILETAGLPAGDRVVAHLLSTGVHDGGQWDMFVNIVKKYGVVPKDVYDETWQSSHTAMMNQQLNRNLKVCAVKLRKMVAEGASEAEIQQAREEMLSRIYGFLCSCYGEPPRTFDFEYLDKDGGYHRQPGCTPLQFCAGYLGDMLDNTVSIIHAPTADKPYHRTFTVRLLGNVVGGQPVKYLNLPMESFKAAIIRQLEAGQVVWFGSDVGKYGERKNGLWDDQSFDFELLTGLDLEISKADGLDYGFSAMNHAMVLTGVDLVDGKPTRWKIENSWGDENGVKGYYVCSDSWFDQYVYQAAVDLSYLGDEAANWAQEPITLEPWDPMGTLAG